MKLVGKKLLGKKPLAELGLDYNGRYKILFIIARRGRKRGRRGRIRRVKNKGVPMSIGTFLFYFLNNK